MCREVGCSGKSGIESSFEANGCGGIILVVDAVWIWRSNGSQGSASGRGFRVGIFCVLAQCYG